MREIGGVLQVGTRVRGCRDAYGRTSEMPSAPKLNIPGKAIRTEH